MFWRAPLQKLLHDPATPEAFPQYNTPQAFCVETLQRLHTPAWGGCDLSRPDPNWHGVARYVFGIGVRWPKDYLPVWFQGPQGGDLGEETLLVLMRPKSQTLITVRRLVAGPEHLARTTATLRRGMPNTLFLPLLAFPYHAPQYDPGQVRAIQPAWLSTHPFPRFYLHTERMTLLGMPHSMVTMIPLHETLQDKTRKVFYLVTLDRFDNPLDSEYKFPEYPRLVLEKELNDFLRAVRLIRPNAVSDPGNPLYADLVRRFQQLQTETVR